MTALHPIERKVIEALKDGGWRDFDHLLSSTGLQPDQVRRSIEWLSSKGLLKAKTEIAVHYTSTADVIPEVKLIKILMDQSTSHPIDRVRAEFASDSEFSAALGRAKSAGWVTMDAGKDPPVLQVLDFAGAMKVQQLAERIAQGIELNDEDRVLLPDLLKRGLVRRIESKTTIMMLTNLGRSTLVETHATDELNQLTPRILESGEWRSRALRPIDVEAPAPTFLPGRRHPVRDFIREVREAYISMGFTEIQGESVQPAFWNFDALYIPQDHPGREMQDTFYIKGGLENSLSRRGIVGRVARTHEDGWNTGSTGWGYKWRVEEARRLVLRTHNTVLTIRALSKSKEKEARVFAVSKVYRNENLDYKHIAEFHQMDGIIVGDGLSTRHLMGFLVEFYKKLGLKDVKLWPTYFPYTEPSLQVMGFSDVVDDWIELGGAGIFRPEVTIPLGVRIPVLAWGPGIERLMLLRFGLDDMRALYNPNLSWLRWRPEFASSKN